MTTTLPIRRPLNRRSSHAPTTIVAASPGISTEAALETLKKRKQEDKAKKKAKSPTT